TVRGTCKSPSPPFRGEREGPRGSVSLQPTDLIRGAGEGEVGSAADCLLSPRPAGGEGKEVGSGRRCPRERWGGEAGEGHVGRRQTRAPTIPIASSNS